MGQGGEVRGHQARVIRSARVPIFHNLSIQDFREADVAYGSFADVTGLPCEVRSAPESRHRRGQPTSQLRAIIGPRRTPLTSRWLKNGPGSWRWTCLSSSESLA